MPKPFSSGKHLQAAPNGLYALIARPIDRTSRIPEILAEQNGQF